MDTNPRFHRYITDGQLFSLDTETLGHHRLARTQRDPKDPLIFLPVPLVPVSFAQKHELLDEAGHFVLEKVMDPATMNINGKFQGILKIVVLPKGRRSPGEREVVRTIIVQDVENWGIFVDEKLTGWVKEWQ